MTLIISYNTWSYLFCSHFGWVFLYRNEFLRLLFSFLLQESVARLEEIKKSVEAKMALRQSNLNPERPGKLLLLEFQGLPCKINY